MRSYHGGIRSSNANEAHSVEAARLFEEYLTGDDSRVSSSFANDAILLDESLEAQSNAKSYDDRSSIADIPPNRGSEERDTGFLTDIPPARAAAKRNRAVASSKTSDNKVSVAAKATEGIERVIDENSHHCEEQEELGSGALSSSKLYKEARHHHSKQSAKLYASGDATRMIEKIVQTWPLSPMTYNEFPPATIPHSEFPCQRMAGCDTMQQRYTQVLIWCLSRRLERLARQETTSKGMRLIHIIRSVRAKLRNGALAPFSNAGGHLQRLRLKATQPNPKNVRNAKDLDEFTTFSKKLDISKQEGINFLEDFEGLLSSVPQVTVKDHSVGTEHVVLQKLHSRAHLCVKQFASRCIEIEGLAEDVREMMHRLQGQLSTVTYHGAADSLNEVGLL